MRDFINRFSEKFAVWSVKNVATMTCAYLFAIIALVALPQAIHDSFANGFAPLPFVTWLSQSFLQLVLLSIIMVGQDVISRATEKRSTTQYDAVMETLTDIQQVMECDREELVDLRQIAEQLARIEAAVTTKKR